MCVVVNVCSYQVKNKIACAIFMDNRYLLSELCYMAPRNSSHKDVQTLEKRDGVILRRGEMIPFTHIDVHTLLKISEGAKDRVENTQIEYTGAP